MLTALDIGSGRVLRYLHIGLDYFFVYSTQLNSTISIIAWYSMLKILIFSTIYSHIQLALDHYEPT